METQPNQFFRRFLSVESAPFTVLVLLVVLAPLFFISPNFISLVFAKSLLIGLGTTIALIFYTILVIKKGGFSFSKNPVLCALGVLNLVYLVSAIFSESRVGSFLGHGFETGTFVALLLASVLTFLLTISFTDSKKIFIAQSAFLVVSGVLVVLQTIFIVWGSKLSLQTGFLSYIANTIGKPSELGIFFAVVAALSLVSLELLKLNRVYKIVLHVGLVLSLFVIAAINFLTIWYVLGAVVLLFFIYQMTFLNSVSSRMSVVSSADGSQETKLQAPRRKVAGRSLVVVIIALLFILPIGRDLSQSVAAKFGVNNIEVRPSWAATLEVFKGSFKTSPVLGPGPNRFASQWQLHHPDINMSDFWNVTFDSGVGHLPTSVTETGSLGLLSWLALLASVVYVGFRTLSVRSVDQFTRYLTVSTFSATLLLWVVNILYPVGPVLFFLTFLFTGLFLAIAGSVGIYPSVSVSFLGRQKLSFIAVTLSVCILIASVGLGYTLLERGRSSVYFGKGVRVVESGGDIAAGENFVLKAASLAGNDIYYRGLANIYILKINNLIAAATGRKEVTEAERVEFQEALAKAIESGRLATVRDPKNFENFAVVGKIYESVVPLQISGAYEAAKTAYEEALKLSPNNLGLFLALARLEAAKGDLPAAEQYIAQALSLKWNYLDAIFLQSQIDFSKGNLPAAIRSVEQIAAISPNDPTIFFRLGLLKYEAKDFTGAVQALERSISLVPVYANAKYFLGLSYAKVGKRAEAVAQFEELWVANSSNEELRTILDNLKAGRDALANASDSQPERRKELPVEEE